MPISARIRGQLRIVSDIKGDEWVQLKGRFKGDRESVIMPCCGKAGLFKGGPGTQVDKHFSHWPDSECDWEESAPHRRAKLIIVDSCREAGFEATPEYSESDWRADVLAVKGDLRIAFEVQWSRQDMEETVRRQEKLRKDGVRGIWLFNNPPKGYQQKRQPEIHSLKHDAAWSFFVEKDGGDIALSQFVKTKLRRLEARNSAEDSCAETHEDEACYVCLPPLQEFWGWFVRIVLGLLIAAFILRLLAKKQWFPLVTIIILLMCFLL